MIRGNDLLDFAAKLAANPQAGPTACRAAVSRAYYGAFHLATSLLKEIGISIGRNHGELQRCFGQSGHPSSVRVSILITELHSKRIKADNHLEISAPESVLEARRAVEIGQQISSLLLQCGTDSAREEIKKGVEAYRNRIKPKPR